MSKLYTVEVTIHATAYIRADSQQEAKAMAEAELKGNAITLENDDCELVSDEQLDSDDLPDVSLSPAATIGELDGEPELWEDEWEDEDEDQDEEECGE